MKKTIIAIVILVVIGIGAYLMFSGSKVPQAFIDKHNENAALGKEAFQLSDLTSMPEMLALNKQMTDKDYSGALKSVEAALIRKKDAAAKLNSVGSNISGLKSMSGEISDSKIKAGAVKFIEIAKKENSVKISYNNLQIQMLEKLKSMVGILAKNPKSVSAADEKTINSLSKQIDDLKVQIAAAEKEVNDVQSQYKEAEKEFFTLADLEIAE
ncbi:MAG: hypothetical protein NTZ97_00360 [Candidatus Moranbacteria bacterium]|nr:hypothetical protein [Candidatus Moranbacteria bacterium]